MKTTQLRLKEPASGVRTFIGHVTGTRYRFGGDYGARHVYEEDAKQLMELGLFAKGSGDDAKLSAKDIEEANANPAKGNLKTDDPKIMGPDRQGPADTGEPSTVTKASSDKVMAAEPPNRGPEAPNTSGKNADDGGETKNVTGKPEGGKVGEPLPGQGADKK